MPIVLDTTVGTTVGNLTDRLCSMDGCEEKHVARGWCSRHYQRWRKHGDPTALRYVKQTMVEKFFTYTNVRNRWECWEWEGILTGGGMYGAISAGSRDARVMAHRWSHEWFIGPIPDGYEVDHICRTHACVNPWHLEAVTHEENMRRARLDDACRKGHRRTPENVYINPSSGSRICRPCKRENQNDYYRKQRSSCR